MEPDEFVDVIDLLDAEVSAYFTMRGTHDNIEMLNNVASSNETLTALIPFLAQDAEAYEFFKLDTPDLAYIRKQLTVAQEGILIDFISGTIPFIELYLNSTGRLRKVLASDKAKILNPEFGIEDAKFNRIKAPHLPLKPHFFEQLTNLTALIGVVGRETSNMNSLDASKFNPTLLKMGLQVKVMGVRPTSVLGAVTGAGATAATNTLNTMRATNITNTVKGYNKLQVEYSKMSSTLSVLTDTLRTIENKTEYGSASPADINNAKFNKMTHEAKMEEARIKMIAEQKKVKLAKDLPKLTMIKSLAIGVGIGQLLAGSVTAITGLIQRLFAQPLSVKGWTKADIIPAIDGVSMLLSKLSEVEKFKNSVNTTFKHEYNKLKQLSGNSDEINQLKENRKLLLNLVGIYIKSTTGLAQGIHEVCSRL